MMLKKYYQFIKESVQQDMLDDINDSLLALKDLGLEVSVGISYLDGDFEYPDMLKIGNTYGKFYGVMVISNLDIDLDEVKDDIKRFINNMTDLGYTIHTDSIEDVQKRIDYNLKADNVENVFIYQAYVKISDQYIDGQIFIDHYEFSDGVASGDNLSFNVKAKDLYENLIKKNTKRIDYAKILSDGHIDLELYDSDIEYVDIDYVIDNYVNSDNMKLLLEAITKVIPGGDIEDIKSDDLYDLKNDIKWLYNDFSAADKAKDDYDSILREFERSLSRDVKFSKFEKDGTSYYNIELGDVNDYGNVTGLIIDNHDTLFSIFLDYMYYSKYELDIDFSDHGYVDYDKFNKQLTDIIKQYI